MSVYSNPSVRFSRIEEHQMHMKWLMSTSFRRAVPKLFMRARRTSGPHQVGQHIQRTDQSIPFQTYQMYRIRTVHGSPVVSFSKRPISRQEMFKSLPIRSMARCIDCLYNHCADGQSKSSCDP